MDCYLITQLKKTINSFFDKIIITNTTPNEINHKKFDILMFRGFVLKQ